MYKQTSQRLRMIVVTAMLSAFFVACKRDDAYNLASTSSAVEFNSASKDNDETSGNFAAAHIEASEKLIIPAAVSLPENLPNGNSRVATYYAIGVQKYKAREIPGSNPVAYEWVFVAPLADLFDENNNKVGTHGAGPFWEISPADSIFAQHFSPAKTSPSPDAGSIDWLLLKPKAGTTPTGIFADVDYIQRIATKGGKAPLTPPTYASETVEVKYKAVYRLSKTN
jgi:hypothetical protein